MNWLSPETLIALSTLTFLEIVLGVDNIIFISILSGKLPAKQQPLARRIGLLLAMGTRILLLFSLAWLSKLTSPLFALWGHEISGRDLILIAGGLFLLAKSTHEIHGKLEGDEEEVSARAVSSFASVLVQIALLDLVFSLDSVITAVGMVDQVSVMIVAVIVSVLIMMLAAEPISAFVNRHPTVKMLALSFLLLIGTSLLLEGFDYHIPKGYVYFAMGFSVFVEMINLRVRRKSAPVNLRAPHVADDETPAPPKAS
jgi:predicted tellurium resistance membrane protein TerC